jgi:Zn ribbon nucleic-acid-binding protein
MSYPKMNPCPRCGSARVAVYSYDHGWKHVECNNCYYLGPGEGSIQHAIEEHNKQERKNYASCS